MKKNLLFLTLTALLSLSALLFCACSPEEDTPEQRSKLPEFAFEYDEETDSYILANYSGKAENVVIPSEYNGKKVSAVGENAFYANESLKSITIPDSILKIGNSSFADCTNLMGVAIPDSVTEIGRSAFFRCNNLFSVTIGKEVTSIGENAFSCIRLVEICNKSALELDLYKIGNYPLNIYTPESGESKLDIRDDGFVFCQDEEDAYLISYLGKRSELTLPKNYNGENYKIYRYAFQDSASLTSVVIPSSVTEIGTQAFSFCKALTNVTMENGVNSISTFAFSRCSNLTSIIIPDSVVTIGSSAFSDCDKLTSITIPDGVVTIGSSAFSGCDNLTKVTLGKKVQEIGSYAFNCRNLFEICNKSQLTLTRGSKDYGEIALRAINIYTPERGRSTLEILDGGYVFCSDEESSYLAAYFGDVSDFAFPESYNGKEYGIYDSLCSGYDFTEIIIPDSVISIGEGAFNHCENLTSVVIGSGVTSIEANAFNLCSSLKEINVPDSVVSIDITNAALIRNSVSEERFEELILTPIFEMLDTYLSAARDEIKNTSIDDADTWTRFVQRYFGTTDPTTTSNAAKNFFRDYLKFYRATDIDLIKNNDYLFELAAIVMDKDITGSPQFTDFVASGAINDFNSVITTLAQLFDIDTVVKYCPKHKAAGTSSDAEHCQRCGAELSEGTVKDYLFYDSDGKLNPTALFKYLNFIRETLGIFGNINPLNAKVYVPLYMAVKSLE